MTPTLPRWLFAATLFTAVPAWALDAPTPTTYSAGVVGFDDLAATQHVSAVADNYQGFSWGDGLVTWSDNGHPSMYAAFQVSAGTSLARADGSAFYFDGADFFLRDGAGTNDIYLFLYDASGGLVYNGFTEKFGRNHIVDTNRSQTFGAVTDVDKAGNASFYSGLVSRVAFGWDGTGQQRIGNANDFGMDNFRYRASPLAAVVQVSSVPEPESYAMLLAGMGLVAAITRRRRNRPV
jgi:hypothetical protein